MPNLRVLIALVSLASVARAAEPTGRSAVDFVATHCGSCHSGKDPEGGLRLDTLRGDMSQERGRWADVRRVVIDKLMPPPDRRQPGSDEIDAIVRWIDANSTAEAQRTPPRRLNRYEFNNAVHALLGIDEDLVRFLPEDAKAHGFDIDAEALAMPGPALEVYLRMASIAVGYAMQDTRPGVATTHRFTAATRQTHQHYTEHAPHFWRGGDAGCVILRPRFSFGNEPAVLPIRLPLPADVPDRLQLTIRLQATVPEKCSTPWLIVVINGIPLGPVPAPASPAPQDFSFVFRKSLLDAQTGTESKEFRLEVMCGYEPVINTYAAVFHPRREAISREAQELKKTDEKFDIKAWSERRWVEFLDGFPTLALDSATLAPAPYAASANALHGLNLASIREAEDRSVIENTLAPFLRYAFRRPVAREEIDLYLGKYDRELQRRGSSRKALESCLVAVLCSPSFLYLIPENDQEGLRDHDLAERLATFFWASIPDRELFDLADAKKLRDPRVLDAQVERMLRDDKASRFFERFASQWLGTAGLRGVHTSMDPLYSAAVNEYLRRSLADEAGAYFRVLVRENLSAMSIIDAPFAVVNDVTSGLYGLNGVLRSEFGRVDLPADSLRGGVTTLASVMTVTDHGKYLPIYRGAWIREAMFGRKLPKPAGDVPPLNPKNEKFQGKSFQEQIKLHRKEQRCAVCHVHLEPIGNAFEIFDAIGQVRERSSGGEKLTPADVSGAFPDGQAYRDLREFKKILGEVYGEEVIRSLVAKLIHFGRGRRPAHDESSHVDGIIAAARRDDFRMRSVLKAVVRSEIFLK